MRSRWRTRRGTRPGSSRGTRRARRGHKTGLAEGHKTGLVEGKRDALLRLLSRRGLALMEDASARMAACADAATLDRWFDNALTASAVADVFS